jgi:hypothetical protein
MLENKLNNLLGIECLTFVVVLSLFAQQRALASFANEVAACAVAIRTEKKTWSQKNTLSFCIR